MTSDQLNKDTMTRQNILISEYPFKIYSAIVEKIQ